MVESLLFKGAGVGAGEKVPGPPPEYWWQYLEISQDNLDIHT